MIRYITSIYIQDFFRCKVGYEGKADAMAAKAAKKLVKDMHYAEFLRERIPKRAARTMSLTSEQYMKVNIEH